MFLSKECYGRIEQHHVIYRKAGGTDKGTIPVCIKHHYFIHMLKITREEVVRRANIYYGYEKYLIPYEGSRKIFLKEEYDAS